MFYHLLVSVYVSLTSKRRGLDVPHRKAWRLSIVTLTISFTSSLPCCFFVFLLLGPVQPFFLFLPSLAALLRPSLAIPGPTLHRSSCDAQARAFSFMH